MWPDRAGEGMMSRLARVGASVQSVRMTLSEDSIEKFKAIWKEEFKEDITDEFARERAEEFLELYATLAEPLPRGNPAHREKEGA